MDDLYFARHGTREVEGWFARQVRGTAPEPPPDGFLVPPGLADEIMAALREGFTAMDEWYESNTGPVAPPSWRTRLRRKRDAWRGQLACRAFRLIAGYDVPDGDDW